ncbi:Putative conserved prophage protein [endosymbiont DhMRE of Dentiscutata heterogama]|uniref:type II toxin-antitoxin system antitoxin SocA domain-containing protein n=1 Tax=endosymbiont DhMRE of Dentiscutata heterogama TaxID=1609546 RepID=UPI000629D743|nr:type II toxin-antitoxin system antitoxin SocA domain-containing protein [endosymbiont DhMRE of Dentiscutata heterogama]CFW92776.1 Putative conserved prophage protein [endosymbiont DhMRE of Dentiscutata heterogama]
MSRTTKLKQLNLNPLSVAKYFYQKGIETSPIIQQLIYFAYLEALKDGYLLFEEEWKAWPNGPVIELVIDRMFENLDKLDKLFVKVEDIKNKLVLNYAEKIFKKYRNKERYIIFEKAQNKPWKDARKPLKSEKEIAKIPFDSLIKFSNGKLSRITI